jgi:hypothetical protein
MGAGSLPRRIVRAQPALMECGSLLPHSIYKVVGVVKGHVHPCEPGAGSRAPPAHHHGLPDETLSSFQGFVLSGFFLARPDQGSPLVNPAVGRSHQPSIRWG